MTAVGVELRPTRQSYAAGDLPEFTVEIKNQGSQPIRLCTYMLDYRMLASMYMEAANDGRQFVMTPFKTHEWAPVRAEDFPLLQPGESITRHVKPFATEGWGLIRNWSQPPLIAPGMSIRRIDPGTYKFIVVFHNAMGLYVGADGMYDFNMERRKLPQDLALPAGVSTSEVFDESVDASVAVTFH